MNLPSKIVERNLEAKFYPHVRTRVFDCSNPPTIYFQVHVRSREHGMKSLFAVCFTLDFLLHLFQVHPFIFCDSSTTLCPWNESDIYVRRYQSSGSHYARSCNGCISLTSDNKISTLCKDGRLVNIQAIYVFRVSFFVAQYLIVTVQGFTTPYIVTKVDYFT